MNEAARVGGLLVTHAHLGNELLAVTEMIVGEVSHIAAVSIGWQEDVQNSRQEIEQAVASVDRGKGVVILTDMFGGTPSNLSLALLRKGELEIVTGVNLPMVIKLAGQSGEETFDELVIQLRDHGKKHISVAGEFL